MLGKKKYKPQLFVNFYLPDVIPSDNFYKVLKSKLDFRFMYKPFRSVEMLCDAPSAISAQHLPSMSSSLSAVGKLCMSFPMYNLGDCVVTPERKVYQEG